MLTFLPLDEIAELEKLEGSEINKAKETLAYELTEMVHGEEEAKKAQEGARALFSAGNAADMPTVVLSDDDFTDGEIGILTLMVKADLAPSNGEARRNVTQGGVTFDGEKVSDPRMMVARESLTGEGKVLKRGKKRFCKVIAE